MLATLGNIDECHPLLKKYLVILSLPGLEEALEFIEAILNCLHRMVLEIEMGFQRMILSGTGRCV